MAAMGSKAVRRYMALIGRRGGRARAKALTPERRAEIAGKAGRAPKKRRASL